MTSTASIDKPRAVLICDTDRITKVFSPDLLPRIEKRCRLEPGVFNRDRLLKHADRLQDLEVIWTTWNASLLSVDDLKKFPQLKAVFSATGTVKRFALPFLEIGIRVCSAKAMNAVPVAEFCVGHILLGGKGFFLNTRSYSPGNPSPAKGKGNFRSRVGLIGGGAIARAIIERLAPFDFEILLHDPYLTEEEFAKLGCTSASLESCFDDCQVVSNHLPNLPSTKGLIRGHHLAAMPQGATFINSGRGAQVRQDEMGTVLRQRPDLTAVLDVTSPMTLPGDSPLWQLSNAILTSHIAGSHGNETGRMVRYLIDSFDRWAQAGDMHGEVTLNDWERLA